MSNYPTPHHCVSCGKVPSIAASLEKIFNYWAMACPCRRMRGPAGLNEIEAVVKWNHYQQHCQAEKDKLA